MLKTFFEEKRIIKKIIIVLIFIFMFNFTFSYLGNNIVFADEEMAEMEITDDYFSDDNGTGKIFIPIARFVLFVADSILQLMQTSFLSSSEIIIKATSDEAKDVKGGIWRWILGGVLIVAGVITCGVGVAAICAAGAAATGFMATAVAIGTAISANMSTILVGGCMIIGGCYAIKVGNEKLKGEFDLPMIMYTPEAIFSNRIPLFNINFFNPVDDIYETKTMVGFEEYEEGVPGFDNGDIITWQDIEYKNDIIKERYDNIYNTWFDEILGYINRNNLDASQLDNVTSEIRALIASDFYEIKRNFNLIDENSTSENITYYWFGNNYNSYIENANEEINEVISCIETGINNSNYSDEHKRALLSRMSYEKVEETYESSSKILQSTVSGIYLTLRTVAMVVLITILVYVGIRIVLSSASKDKAKYKQMLIDWLVAFILLFVLHYVMAFIISISEIITEICNGSNIENIPIVIPKDTRIDIDGTMTSVKEYLGINAGREIAWGSNFIGYVRFNAGLIKFKRIHYGCDSKFNYVFGFSNIFNYV